MPPTFFFFFFNDTATTEIYTLSLHDALPISPESLREARRPEPGGAAPPAGAGSRPREEAGDRCKAPGPQGPSRDRKSTRLNSSHGYISYAVFCLKKKKHDTEATYTPRGLYRI